MPPEDSYRRQVELLVKVLPSVASERCFAIKGGTAINLFVREDMPRISVDIDLTYLPVADRRESLRDIDSTLRRIALHVQTTIPSVHADTGNHKIWFFDGTAQIKTEVSPVLRGCVHEPREMSVTKVVEDEFGGAIIQVVSFPDLYAGKIMAALDRQHPRDLYDVHGLLTNEGIDDKLRAAFIVYLLSGRKPIGETLSPKRTELSDLFDKHLSGMVNDPVPLDVLYQTREALVADIVGNMPDHHRRFLMGFEKGEPDWSLLEIPHAETLPAVQWRMLNLAKVGDERRSQLVGQLEVALGSESRRRSCRARSWTAKP